MVENGNTAELVQLAHDAGKLEAEAETAKAETEEIKEEIQSIKTSIEWGENERKWLDEWITGRLEEINRRLDALELAELDEVDIDEVYPENGESAGETVIEMEALPDIVPEPKKDKRVWGLF